MSDAAVMSGGLVSPVEAERAPTDWRSPAMQARIRRRYAAERRFRLLGLASLIGAALFLVYLLVSISITGVSGFLVTEVRLTVAVDADTLGVTAADARTPEGEALLDDADWLSLIKDSLRARFPEVESRAERRELASLLSEAAAVQLRAHVMADPAARIGKPVTLWFTASSVVDQYAKGSIDLDLPEEQRLASDRAVQWLRSLEQGGDLRKIFNTGFFTQADSSTPELAGVWGAIKGSLMTLFVTVAICFPIGVAAAIYLEEFAPRNRITDLIEVNINNLAAVPSIIFGLLGLAVFLGTMGLPRSAPVVGGLTLALLTLPTIVIAGRVAIKSVPPSIRDAATGLGASPLQVVFHHVLPLAMPGILTGSIIGMARALGESAPLLMIGMRAFVVDPPQGFSDAATVLPVQVFLWSDNVDPGFVEKTSAAIIVLLVFLILMNSVAIFLRHRFERRW